MEASVSRENASTPHNGCTIVTGGKLGARGESGLLARQRALERQALRT